LSFELVAAYRICDDYEEVDVAAPRREVTEGERAMEDHRHHGVPERV
jgi:hypothetical protein